MPGGSSMGHFKQGKGNSGYKGPEAVAHFACLVTNEEGSG